MQFQGPNATGARLTDYEGRVVALAYLEDRTIPTEDYGLTEAILARFWAQTDTGWVDLGETLVFQQVIRSTVKNANGNGVVARLHRATHDKYEGGSMLRLQQLTPDAEQVAIAALSALVNG